MLLALVLGVTSCEALGRNETMNCNMVRPEWEYSNDGLMARSLNATQEPSVASGPNALCAQSQQLTNAALAAFNLDFDNIFQTFRDRVQTAELPIDAFAAPEHSDDSAQKAHNPFAFPISVATGALEHLSLASADITFATASAVSVCTLLSASILVIVFLFAVCAFTGHLFLCIGSAVACVAVDLAPFAFRAFSHQVQLLIFYCVVRPVCLLIAYLFTFTVGTVSLPIWLLVF